MKTDKRAIAFLVLSAAAMLITGCGVVAAVQPPGEEAVVLDPEKWEGYWYNGTGVIHLRVADSENGLLLMTGINIDEDPPGYSAVEIYIRASGSTMFASLRSDFEENGAGKDDSTAAPYLWGMVKNEDEQLFFWSPNRDMFSQLVSDGTLPGSFDGEDVILGELGSKEQEVLISDERGVLYDWREPLVLVRLNR